MSTSTLFFVLAQFFNVFFNLVNLLIILSVAVSWFNPDPNSIFILWLRRLTEPMYRPIRKLIGHYTYPIDIAPTIIMFLTVALGRIVPTYFMALSYKF